MNADTYTSLQALWKNSKANRRTFHRPMECMNVRLLGMKCNQYGYYPNNRWHPWDWNHCPNVGNDVRGREKVVTDAPKQLVEHSLHCDASPSFDCDTVTIVWQLKFNRFLHPNEQPQRII